MEEAGYIVIGAGAFGASTAYNLARRGARGVVLLDRFEVGAQTSPRAAGLTSKVTGTELHTRLTDEAVEHLARFEAESGRSINFHRSGSLKAALTPSGVERLERDAARAQALGIRAEFVTHQRANELAPFFHPGRARTVLYCPEDAWVDPETIAVGFAARAAEAGVEIRPNTPVDGVLHRGGAVIGVQTARGEIRAPVVVDAAGAWSRLVAEVAGIRVPLVPTRHQLYATEPIPGVEPLQPIVRILETSVYVRHERGGLLVGGYEDEPRQVAVDQLPATFQIRDLPLDFGPLRGLTEEVLEFFPALREARIREHRGGLPTLTPDGQFIVGPVPNLAGFYLISGCNVGGLSLSPAVGRALVDLILDGRCEPDLRPYYVERFGDAYQDPGALLAACKDAYARKYVK
ncbi:MAG: NAD(P)/FAD-dependent oxidoreductase [Chloroflexota bacterium]